MEWQFLAFNSMNTCFWNILRNYEKVTEEKKELPHCNFALISRDRVTRAMGCLNISKSAHRFISVIKVSCDAATSKTVFL